MNRLILASAAALVLVPVGLYAVVDTQAPAPSQIAAAAPASDWVKIPEKNLIVMETAKGPGGQPAGRVVIQLAPEFAPIHIANIRTLTAANWWDGTSINRVQDNYVVQWGDATEKKPMPDGITEKPPEEYVRSDDGLDPSWIKWPDPYAKYTGFAQGWPVGGDGDKIWLTHCYGMIGVGRNMAPDTGTGAELYTVIGHAPRHLDKNITLVGRVIEGMEYLSSRPRGTGDLGFYTDPTERITITSVKAMADVAPEKRASYQYLTGKSFDAYAKARANRRDPFFNVPAGGADVCNIPVPIKRAV